MLPRGRALALMFTLTASAVLAGCVGADEPAAKEPTWDDLLARLSQPIYAEVEKLNVQVPGHDGKMQDNWVYKPKADDPNARFPVFINFSPYWYNLGGDPSAGGDAFSKYMIEEYVPRGYAVVLASVRGTGHSGGCFPIGGVTEMEDAYAVIDHFANVEWSNGVVAAGGKSYDGTTIQGVAGYKPHPALRLIFPVSGISDLYRYNYRGGVPYGSGPIFNAYYYAGVGLGEYGDPADTSPYNLVDDVACADLPFVQAHGVATGVHGMYNDYWNERNYIRYAANVETAIFYVHGFQDWNVKPDHILPWITSLPEGTITKAYLHQWRDDGTNGTGTGHVYPMRDDYNITMLRMLDHYLKDIDTGVLDEPAFHVQDSEGVWRTEEAWPPADHPITPFHPQADGTLAATPGEGTAALRTTPDAPETFTWSMDVTDTIHYAGAPVLTARLSTTDPYTAWVAQLWLEEDGKRTWMNEGVLRAYLRDSMETPSPVVPGQLHEYAIEFYPQDDVFPAGSKLVLTLGTDGARHAVAVGAAAELRIDLAATALELPLVDPGTRAWESPQPVETVCWAC